MSEHIKQTINELRAELGKQEAAILEKKKLINMLCAHAGLQPMYADTELQAASGPSLTIRADQFYGQSMFTVLRQILEMRKGLGQGPATITELHAAMVEGGFAFDAKDDDNAKRSIRISVTKNSGIFHKIPSGRIGLLEWYPNAKQTKVKKAATEEVGSDADSAEDESESSNEADGDVDLA